MTDEQSYRAMTSEELYRAIEEAHETVMNFTPRQLKAAWDSGLLDARSRVAWEERNGPLPPPPYKD